MNKVCVLSLILFFIFPFSISSGNPVKQLEKAKEKERKEVLKRLKKENWRVLDSSKSIEVALMEHWVKMDQTGYDEVVGVSSKGKNKNQLMTMAMNNAIVTYSQLSSQKIKAFATALYSGDTNNVNKELESFYDTYVRALSKEIHGELMKSFVAYRENGDGSIEVCAFYIIDSEKADESRNNTLQRLSNNDDEISKVSKYIIETIETHNLREQ